MYYEAKVLFVLYLWHPKTQGAVYLYNTVLQPFLSQNEASIDQCIEELRTTFFDYAAAYFQKCANLQDALSHSFARASATLQALERFATHLAMQDAAKGSFGCRLVNFVQANAHHAIACLQQLQAKVRS